MKITMSDGRTVTLHWIDVQGSYFGQMEGRPGEITNNFILERLRAEPSSFHIIEPTLDLSDPEYPELPKYQVRCTLSCRGSDGDAWGTRLNVAFFCDDVSSQPIPKTVEEAVQDLDWDHLAREFDLWGD
jgi:hypothetical protein